MGRKSLPRETRMCAAPGCDKTFTVIITSPQKYCCSGHAGKGVRRRHLSLEHRKHLGDAKRGKKTCSPSQETRKKIADSERGKSKPPLSPEHCKKIGDSQRGKSELPFSLEHCKNLSNAKQGTKNPNWQGGISSLPYPPEFAKDLKLQVWDRDENTCQICKLSIDQITRRGHVHHINYDKKDSNSGNLILLCASCHGQTNRNREYWTPILRDLMKRRFES